VSEPEKFGDWQAALKVVNKQAIQSSIENEYKPGLLRAAEALRAEVIQGIRSKGSSFSSPMQALHPFTVARKGSAHPLVDKGDMLGNIHTFQDGLEAGVGIQRSARNSRGGALVNIAAVHENGAVVTVTDKMRAYLHAVGLHLKPTTQTIIIPARPFFGPALKKAEPQVQEILQDATLRFVDGLIG
jgi:phage gpG-like protein